MNAEQFSDILVYFSESLLGKENEEDILWDLAKNCIAKLGFVDCVIYLIDRDNKMLVQKAAYGPKNPKDNSLYNPVEIALGEGITGHVALTGVSEIIKDTSKDLRYIEDDELRLSEICVPISHEGTIYGIIDCEHPKKNFFTKKHLKMLSAIASICAIKIKSVRVNRALLSKQNRLLRLKEEMVELKLKALNSQLNPHFVFNALNAIQSFIASEKKKQALEYLSIFSKLIRFYLKHLDKETVNLKDEVDMLHWYLELQKLRYNDKFEYTIMVEKEEKVPSAAIPSFVIQTLFENIVERSIFHQHKNQRLDITFLVKENTVTLHIKYRHESDNSNTSYSPGYRENIVQWEDQIRLLNAIKPYKIEKEIVLIDDADLSGSNISLKLPNLI
ncbi:histidine kinase [Flagellimonas pacifica]|uniref:histidine kinase n=1 Tax=Flagellimonas pacifica TaxID=1247520 RepID=UPI000BE38E47|nr:histidine kinase [Allomuricauda parva]